MTTTTEDSVTTYSFTVFDGEKDVEVTSKSLAGVAKATLSPSTMAPTATSPA